MGPRAGDQRERNGMHLAPVAGVSGKPRAPVQVARALVEGGADPDARDSMARGPSPASPSPCSRGISGADLVNAARVGHRAGWRCTTACRKVSQRALCSYSTQGRITYPPLPPSPQSNGLRLTCHAPSASVPPVACALCPPLLACRVLARGAGSQRGAPRQDARDHQGLSPSDLTNLEGSGGY